MRRRTATIAEPCREIWWNWSVATMSRERPPRSKCSKRRWINGERSPTTTGGSRLSAPACRRPPCTACRRSMTTCSSRAGAGTCACARGRRASPPPPTGTSRRSSRRWSSSSASARTTAASASPRPSASATATRARRSATATRSTPAPARSSACSPTRRTAAAEPHRESVGEPVLLRQGDWSGYAARTTPEALLEQVKAANVRGRGGAGFPAGNKWEFAARVGQPGEGHRGQRRRGRPRLLYR